MIATIQYNSRKLRTDLSKPLDISIPIMASDKNVNAWYIGPPKIIGSGCSYTNLLSLRVLNSVNTGF